MTATRIILYEEKTYTFDEAADLLQIKGPMHIRSLTRSLVDFAQHILGDDVHVSARYHLFEGITLMMKSINPDHTVGQSENLR